MWCLRLIDRNSVRGNISQMEIRLYPEQLNPRGAIAITSRLIHDRNSRVTAPLKCLPIPASPRSRRLGRSRTLLRCSRCIAVCDKNSQAAVARRVYACTTIMYGCSGRSRPFFDNSTCMCVHAHVLDTRLHGPGPAPWPALAQEQLRLVTNS